MTNNGRREIKALSAQFNLTVASLTGDCFMQAPFWKEGIHTSKGLKDDFLAICRSCSSVGIKKIVVPLVDNGRLETRVQEKNLVEFLLSITDLLAALDVQIIFETDHEPGVVREFIDLFPRQQFGINYDIGNSASLGFDPIEELDAYGSRVLNIHVKDRVFGGTTVPLKEGDADFPLVFSKLREIGYDGNYIIQAARAKDGDHIGAMKAYLDMVADWLQQDSSVL